MKEITYVGMVLPDIMKLSVDFETNAQWKITEIDDEVTMATSIKNDKWPEHLPFSIRHQTANHRCSLTKSSLESGGLARTEPLAQY